MGEEDGRKREKGQLTKEDVLHSNWNSKGRSQWRLLESFDQSSERNKNQIYWYYDTFYYYKYKGRVGYNTVDK